MTVNVQGPFGFLQVGVTGGAPNFARAGSTNPFKIKSSFVTPIYFGDAVRMWVSGDDASGAVGYITPWVNGDGATATKILVGIFQGCEYYSTSQKKTIFSNYYPGSDATGDVAAYVVNDPLSQWMVQSSTSTAINAQFLNYTVDVAATPTGNTTTGYSGMAIVPPSTGATAATLPFRVVGLVTSPPGVPGTDTTTGFNNVIVAFNNQMNRALLGV